MPNPRKPLTGKTFGLLKVLSYAGKNKSGNSMWLCECECGTKVTVAYQHLTAGRTKSCGHMLGRWPRKPREKKS